MLMFFLFSSKIVYFIRQKFMDLHLLTDLGGAQVDV